MPSLTILTVRSTSRTDKLSTNQVTLGLLCHVIVEFRPFLWHCHLTLSEQLRNDIYGTNLNQNDTKLPQMNGLPVNRKFCKYTVPFEKYFPQSCFQKRAISTLAFLTQECQ